jgi:F0F1-type ATP synthase gamma subunit
MMDKLINKEYSRINLIYIHYYNLSKQKIQKRAILPFDYTSDEIAGDSFKEIKAIDDFVVEGDLEYILWNLIVTYLSIEIKIADAWGWASENVQRQMFTNSSLNKIKEQNEEKRRIERKEIKSKEFKQIIENNNRRKNKEED